MLWRNGNDCSRLPGRKSTCYESWVLGEHFGRMSLEDRRMDKNKYLGSCLCGEVRFEVEGEFERFYLCHCQHCRKDTGSAHASNLFSSSASLKWTSGEEKVRQFDLPGTRHSKSFCCVCGSALPMLQMDGVLLVVPAGSLNTEIHMIPDAHIFVSSRAGWDRALDELPTFDTFPS